MLDATDRRWLQASLSHAYDIVDKTLNRREAKVGRRNQVLYALGRVRPFEFSFRDVEEILRAEFPASTAEKHLNVSGILSELSKTTDPLVRRAPSPDKYIFTDPVFRMCLRAMLRKHGETVIRLDMAALGTA